MINNYKNHKKHLLVFVTNLLNLYFKDNKKINKDKIYKSFNQAYDRLIYCARFKMNIILIKRKRVKFKSFKLRSNGYFLVLFF